LEREDEMGVFSRAFQTIIDAFRSENVVLEERIAEKNAELENQYTYILEREKAASLGNLVAGVAHEINTPVGVSLSTASYLKKVSEECRQKLEDGQMTKTHLVETMSVIDESIRLMTNNLERAVALVKSFKNLAVDQSSGMKECFELKASIDGVILSLLHEYKHLPITIENRCPAEIYLEAYPGAVSQIFTNLIINSLRHGLNNCTDGKIEIMINIKTDVFELIYQDNGSGIASEHIGKIYDPFFTTNRHDGSTGLGMNIVMNLVKQKLKGSIRCESNVGEGVKFFIELPIEMLQEYSA
jgi:signal transduction histidine kinase